MAAQQICVVFLVLLSFLSSPSVPQKISAQVGEDVEIQCRGPEDGKVLVLEWIQSDLGPDGYLYLYRDGSVMDNHQHPFFKNRVELRDPEMKKGDLSVILKKVTFNDSGVYKCLSLFETFKAERRESQEVNLTVTEAETSEGGATEEEGGVTMKIVGIVFGVVLVLICVLVFFLIHQCKKQKKTKNIIVKSPEPGDENPEESDTESSTNRDNRNHAFAYVKHGSLPRKESKAFLLEHV